MIKRLLPIAAAAVLLGTSGASSAALPLRQIADIPLPGNPTRFDYQSYDARRHLLFIAHLGDSEVIAFDTKRRRVIATIPNVRDVHGVLAVPALGVVYASATGTDEVVAIEESTLRIVGRSPAGVYPDGLAFDPRSRRLFVSDEHGGTETVIDTRSNRRIATISLGGEVGNTQYDPNSGRMFVNVEGRGELAEIDPNALTVLRRVSTSATGCIGNHGLLIDAQSRRAFVACESSGSLLWIDMRTMRIVKTWQVGDDPDVLAADTVTKRIFIAAESGIVSVFSNGTEVQRAGQAFLAAAAHTVAVDSATRLAYFPLESVNGKPVLRIMAEDR